MYIVTHSYTSLNIHKCINSYTHTHSYAYANEKQHGRVGAGPVPEEVCVCLPFLRLLLVLIQWEEDFFMRIIPVSLNTTKFPICLTYLPLYLHFCSFRERVKTTRAIYNVNILHMFLD